MQRINNTENLQDAVMMARIIFTVIQLENPKITEADLPEFCRDAAAAYNLPDESLPEIEREVRKFLIESAPWIDHLQIVAMDKKPRKSYAELLEDIFGARTQSIARKGQ